MASSQLIPITRETPDQRLNAFLSDSNAIYNKFSPYDDFTPGTGIGAKQPYVWIKPSDSSTSLNLIKYDTQAIPIGSTIRDEIRLTKFMASGTGLIFIGKQLLLQQQTAFNETRIYNPLSILSAAAQQGSTGLIERPTRYIEGGFSMGGLINMAASLIGQTPISSPVQGVATGLVAPYAGIGLGDKGKGYMHLQTGQSATSRFGKFWTNAGASSGGGFLQQLGASLLKTAQNLISSTLPFGIGTSDTSLWAYRPEYPNTGTGVFETMRKNSAGYLTFSVNNVKYYVEDIAPNYPDDVSASTVTGESKTGWYDPAPSNLPTDKIQAGSNLKAMYNALATATFKFNGDYIGGGLGTSLLGNQRPLREQSTESIANNYVKNVGENGKTPTTWENTLKDPLTLAARGFSSAPAKGKNVGSEDTYNSMIPFVAPRTDTGDSIAPTELMFQHSGWTDLNDSKDIIFFYFFDLINNTYIPFRATITGLNDLHTPEWDEVAYLGRADKLYVYKGFTRDVNFSFTVYANSIKEMVPMWKRINYLVGLARPSGYTSGVGTAGGDNITKQFMYPPMVTVRIGDMYVDQPCVLKSIGVNIPEDATWETQRGVVYTYLKGSGVDLSKYNNDIMYQLPKKVDMTINMSIMEKKRSVGNGDHFYVSPTPPPEPKMGGIPPAPAKEVAAGKAPAKQPSVPSPAAQITTTITPTEIISTPKEPLPIGINRHRRFYRTY
jgi:hypothetical protein